jgi:heme/copper-type cytochrome/quinol oxidase subunit 2
MVVAKGETATLSTMLFIAWVIIGLLIYLGYGYRKNREAEVLGNVENEKITSNI